MRDEIISYGEMCAREGGRSLQNGMYFAASESHSILLMSQRKDAPYSDVVLPDGLTIEYEGHDAPRSVNCPDPKTQDQPRFLPSGKPTQNGRFAQAVDDYKAGKRPAPVVRIYEKLFRGIWSDKGYFEMTDYELRWIGGRNVFRFRLRAITEDPKVRWQVHTDLPVSRLIPANVKKEVWKRDKGRCTYPGCNSRTNLHFDHDIPYSKGGSSLTPANVRLLCAKHNLQKGNKIE